MTLLVASCTLAYIAGFISAPLAFVGYGMARSAWDRRT